MKQHFPKLPLATRLLAETILLVFVFGNAHWSVFVTLVFMTLAIEGMSSLLAMQGKMIRAMRQLHNEDKANFNTFIDTINAQARAVKKEMNICRECELHGHHGVRPGSIHNKAADNCLMKDKPNQV